MKKIKFFTGFTLVEMIVWITISLILMLSVSMFVSSAIKNILIQQNVLENNDDFNDFINKIQINLNLINSWSFLPEKTSSWIIFKRSKYFSDWWFSYIWEETLSWVFCDSDSETPETKSLFIKSFIPFEENSEDIYSDFDSILTWNTTWYISYQKEHVVKNSSWNIVIWKWIFWDNFTEWASWTDIYLNSPTWLAYDWINILYISDTLNSRILFYNINNNTIHKLLDESDWLNEPTGLYYNNNKLYISNSWKWEILEYSSEKITSNPNFKISFIPNDNIININNLSISFLPWSIILTWHTSKSNFSFTNITTNTDYITKSTNTLNYYFTNYLNPSSSSEVNCNFNGNKTTYTLDWSNNPIKNVISWCNTSTWTLVTWSWNINNLFNSWSTYDIDILNIYPNFTDTWSYYVNLKLFNWTNEKYSDIFWYFTQSDNDLLTFDDNTLKILYSWLNYPTWIWWTWNSDYREFWDWTYWNMLYSSKYDTLLNVPIESLIHDTSNNLLTMILKYYRVYNCYNPDNKSERIFITKKNL